MDDLSIAVLGGGHQGYAVAGDLALRGFDVRLWRRDAAALGDLADTGELRVVKGSETATAQLRAATATMAEAVAGTEVVVVAVPATAHAAVAAQLAGCVEADATVVLTPGNLGSIVFASALGAGHTGGIAETPHPFFGARKRRDGSVAIAHPTIRLPLGVLPAVETQRVLDRVQPVFEQLQPARDVLDAALCNPNPVIHPALMVTNAGPVEAYDAYDIHATGTTASTLRLIYRVDAERVALREALGYGAPHWEVSTLYDPAQRGSGFFPAETFDTVTASGDWNEALDLSAHRYVREDAAIALATWSALARAAGVAVATIDALLGVLSGLLGEDIDTGGSRLGAPVDLGALRELLSGGVRS